MFITTGKELLTRQSRRVATVPYVYFKDELYFLFGISSKEREICDAGGGIKKMENDLDAAIRELSEETCKIFDKVLTKEYLSSCIAVVLPEKQKYKPRLHNNSNCGRFVYNNGGMSVIYAPVNKIWLNQAQLLFEKASEDPQNDNRESKELERLIWVTEQNFLKLLNDEYSTIKMWPRLQSFYKKIYTPQLKNKIIQEYTKKFQEKINQKNSQYVLIFLLEIT